jgi:pimeloyl-ACP methyl ester carboxylesterase
MEDQMTTATAAGYAPVNGLRMYYEVHGSGRPLLLLHGAFMTANSFGDLLPGLAARYQVIVPEMQAHGRTGDIDRPITYEQLADDCAALLRHLGIEQADIVGYSLGGATVLQLAIRHPELVRKIVPISASFSTDGWYAEAFSAIAQITPEMFDGTPWKQTYLDVAPNPNDFPTLVEKVKALDSTSMAWPPESIGGIKAPAFVIIGDSDGTKPEHAVDMFRLFGGGVMGDLAGMPASQLAILPGTHHVGMLERSDWLLDMIPLFLDAPLPDES